METPSNTTLPKQESLKDENIIEITSGGSPYCYLSQIELLLEKMGKTSVTITGSGPGIIAAMMLAMFARRRFTDLHSVTSLDTDQVVDGQLPAEEGLHKFANTVNLPNMSKIWITFSKDAPDSLHRGYAPPIANRLVVRDPGFVTNNRGPTRGRSPTKGAGKGKGVDRRHEDDMPALNNIVSRGASKGNDISISKGSGRRLTDGCPPKGRSKGGQEVQRSRIEAISHAGPRQPPTRKGMGKGEYKHTGKGRGFPGIGEGR